MLIGKFSNSQGENRGAIKLPIRLFGKSGALKRAWVGDLFYFLQTGLSRKRREYHSEHLEIS
jgi:hypothetical protein